MQFAADAASYGWPGSGTTSDPFIIEDLVIDAEGASAAIYVGNVTFAFVVRDCELYNATLWRAGGVFMSGNGIALYNDAWVRVESCYIHNDADSAIRIVQCQKVVAQDNICGSTDTYPMYGIDVSSCNDVTISGNTISHFYIGALIYSENVGIDHNEFVSNAWWGICFDNDHCSATDNTCEGSTEDGIITYASDCTILNNTCTFNGKSGIYLTSSATDCLVCNNTCVSNGLNGIKVDSHSDRTRIENNSCSGAQMGITIDSSDDVYLRADLCSGNSDDGYDLNDISRGTLVDCRAVANDGDGLFLYGGKNCSLSACVFESNGNGGAGTESSETTTVTGCTFTNNGYWGAVAWDDRLCTFSNNSFQEDSDMGLNMIATNSHCVVFNNSFVSNYYGIIVWDSTHDTWIHNNTFSYNTIGLEIRTDSTNNSVTGNLFHDNVDFAIEITQSQGNYIYRNQFTSNHGSGLRYDAAHAQAWSFNGNFFDGTGHGNLWSDWRTPDLNRDGVVDLPYIVPGGNCQDMLPVMPEDVFAPNLVITSPQQGAVVGSLTFDVNWTAWDNESGLDHFLICPDSAGWVDIGYVFTHSVTFTTYGEHSVAVRAVDNATNEYGLQVGFRIAVLPDAPRGLVASSLPSKIHLNWTAPASDGGSPITLYTIYRSEMPLAWTAYRQVTGLEFDDRNVTFGHTYYYHVNATNAVGEGSASNDASATANGPPSAPRGLTAIAGNHMVTLNWTAPSYVGPGSLTYHLYRNGSILWSGAGISHIDTSTANGFLYTYTVSASNSVGWGLNSTSASAAPIGPPSAPRDLAGETGNGMVNLSWMPPSYYGPGGITYHLFRNGTLIWSGTTEWHPDTGLTNYVHYAYNVAASNSLGWGANSTGVVLTPVPSEMRPTAPRDLAATAGNGNMTLTWTAPLYSNASAISEYVIWIGTSPTHLAYLYNSSSPGCVLNGMTKGTTYYVKVWAINSAGQGTNSSTVPGTPFGAPEPPRGLAAIAGAANASLNWTTPTYIGPGALTYHVFRNGALVWSGTANVYVDTGLTSGVHYTYTVSAGNSVGWGQNATAVHATPTGSGSDWTGLLIVILVLVVAGAAIAVVLTIRMRKRSP